MIYKNVIQTCKLIKSITLISLEHTQFILGRTVIHMIVYLL